MEAKELRELGLPELKSRVNQWKEELFRAKLKKFGGEAKDTTAPRKLRRDIARALTVIRQKGASSGSAATSEPIDQPVAKAASAAAEGSAKKTARSKEKKTATKAKVKK